jgi:hypothetical protein
MTVAKKARPQPRAANLRRFFSILKYTEYFGEEKRSSDVRIRITAVTASHKLISESESGNCINLDLE